jgi:hypothetical protein
LLVARDTPTRTRLNTSSAVTLGTRISFISSLTNTLLPAAVVSLITRPSATEYMASVLSGASSGARPSAACRKRRS